MTNPLRSLEVREVVLHIVPQAGRGDQLQLSDALCVLQEGVRGELQGRIRGQLSSIGRQVVEDPKSDSDVPEVVRNYLQDPAADLIPASKRLAELLRDVQKGNASAGMLMVAQCLVLDAPALLIVKFEQEKGLRAQPKDDNGRTVFDMQFLNDLFLTNKSKVFKVGLFSLAEPATGTLAGWAADKQNSGGKVATYFLEAYLGCQHLEEPEELTRRFYDESLEWINKHVETPSRRSRYVIAVMAEMQSERDSIAVDRFAETHLDPVEDADRYEQFLRARGVPRFFQKATAQVQSRLEQMQIGFSNGITVVFPISALEDGSVEIEELSDTQSQVTLTGETREAKPRARRPRSAPVEGELQGADVEA
ncbi:nucleoid-associated protein [Plantactinospora sp. WMMB334]|uniref:nucleoid-associated protein n=1 Tax=Plantactinospora sp. WMMB334 TaxID=3404119 RepID=UPI003B93717C